jgi:tetratricopeptide (TPR) repeat protein
VTILISLLLMTFVQGDLYKEGQAQLEAKHYDAAEAAFRQMIQADDSASSSKAYAGLARVEIGRKNYDKAMENAKKAVDLNGEEADAHYALGLAYAYRQDFKNAAPSLEKALSLNPENAYAHYQLGMVQYRLKRYDQTIIHFEKFLQLMPNAPEAPQVKSILKTVRG